MKKITFFDTEVSIESNRILDIGAIRPDGSVMRGNSLPAFLDFVLESAFLCGHNVVEHDLKHIGRILGDSPEGRKLAEIPVIDTLHLSALLFPKRPYHALVKDDKLQTEEINNPVNDSKKAMDLFGDETAAFHALSEPMKCIFTGLLNDKPAFSGFFKYLEVPASSFDIKNEIQRHFDDRFCSHADLAGMIVSHPVELAYCLALINTDDDYSVTPPWILRNYPGVDRMMHQLRGVPCLEGCGYCNDQLDGEKGLKRFFGYDSYRTYDGEPLQKRAVDAAIGNGSLLAVFPTGGGKSITFQVPALMAGKAMKGLTVIISPLQSLMKDQVDNLERNDITDAVTINGLLDPIERAESIRRVKSGEATILYISPELLRSKTIERLLLGRKVVRFVIDEAHCFSAWGQDFRVDYLYIGDFIRSLYEQKNLTNMIPVSCFTATAKQNVIDDIRAYFKEKLNLDLELFTASSARKNLHYKVIAANENDKYQTLRNLIESRDCPTIVYVSRTKKAEELADRLAKDGYLAKAYHGRMDKNIKSSNQDFFIEGDVRIMVATSAFGMGVDKKDVGMVVHYDISDSLENYVQEAGRAGRDASISADCYVLFNDEDLNKHFMLLNQTKIGIQEIQQVWKAIKDTTRTRNRMSNSALEIAREAGWDENVREIETRVRTAIAALEDAGYVKRGQNEPRVYADSILARSATSAIEMIKQSGLFSEKEEEQAVRIIKKLIASRSRSRADGETGEARIDYISDDLGIEKKEVIRAVQLLREAGVLADAKDLVAYMQETGRVNRSLNTLAVFSNLERFLIREIPDELSIIHLKALNERAETEGLKDPGPDKIRTIINFWVIKDMMRREASKLSHNRMRVAFKAPKDKLLEVFEKRSDLAEFILNYLDSVHTGSDSACEFSVLELKEAYNMEKGLFQELATTGEVEDALLYLSRIGALKMDGGFLVVYNRMSIERLELDNKIKYKNDDYRKLKQYYEQKTQMIHIVGEYAKKMLEDYQSALQFVEDYFQLEYSAFLGKYFKGSKGGEILRNLTPAKFRQLFGELSPTQLKIINDKETRFVVVAAGPGSGKTRILVHKLASLLLMEDVKHEQLLMITFSRAAATEFKSRLQKLIGNAAHFVEIKTFHSYCFDLLGRVGNIEKSSDIVRQAAAAIEEGAVEMSRITKTVLVIDEAQDMDEDVAELVRVLVGKNEDMRVIAVGDDDQNIYAFRGSDSKHMKRLMDNGNACLYELVENYRSRPNLVAFTNLFVERMAARMKSTPIMPVQTQLGRIRVTRYSSEHLIEPVVGKMIEEGIKGSTCILTKTNDEALQITTLFRKRGIRANLIQGNGSYNLYNLDEVRYFIGQLDLTDDVYTISDEVWDEAKRRLFNRYARSENLPLCRRMLREFETVNNRYKYVSDFMIFIRESQEEDFYDDNQSAVCVSTMHKAKGKEFDHVVIMLDRFQVGTDEAKRQLYVAMTRAKESLAVHYNGSYLEKHSDERLAGIEGLEYVSDSSRYSPANHIAIQLTHSDVFLDYFFSSQRAVGNLMSGDMLGVDGIGCYAPDGERMLRFSSKFKEEIAKQEEKGYKLLEARVNQVVYWQKECGDEDRKIEEIRIVLPEVVLSLG